MAAKPLRQQISCGKAFAESLHILDKRIGVSNFPTSTNDCLLGLLDVGIWGIALVTDNDGLLGLDSRQGSDSKSENSGDNGELHDYSVSKYCIERKYFNVCY